MEDESIKFKDWRTGKKEKYRLSNSHPAEHKTKLICPFDKTPLIFAYNDLSKWHYCPNCNLQYSLEFNTQKEVNKYFRGYLNKLKKESIGLDNRKKEISLILEKAEESFKITEYNKANLSAQESKIINIKNYQSKQDKENLKKFFSLSDHLFPGTSDEKDQNPAENA